MRHALMATSCSTTAVDLSGKTVWVIDLFSRIYQLFHALPEMTAPDGTPVSAVFGLTRDLLDIIERSSPTICCVARTPLVPRFAMKNSPTTRRRGRRCQLILCLSCH